MATSLAFLYLILSVLITLVYAQNGPTSWTVSPFNSPSFPLAVKTPYINAWDPQGNGPAPISNSWSRIGSTVFTPVQWLMIITVDGTPYRLMGTTIDSNDPVEQIAEQISIILTPTRTSFLFQAGPVTVNATYLSPVEPNDLVQLSLPFSYYYLTITSNSTHSISVYSDITGDWMTGDSTLQTNWTAFADNSVVYLQTQLTSPSPFTESQDRPMDGIAYHATLQGSGVTWQIASVDGARGQFVLNTALKNTVDPEFHSDGQPVFEALALAMDLGSIQSTSEPIVWAVAVVRDPIVQYANAAGQQEERSAYYWSNYTDIRDAILGVLNNFDIALNNAISLDNQILHDGSRISTDYYDLLALTTRQAMGSLDVTIVRDESGNWNMSDVKAFLRSAGGIGSGGVNAVDVIYATCPVYLYLNPEILGYLLRPLLEYQESDLYPNSYAALDIGTNYSMAIGNNEAHNEGIEQSGNMIILAYAHAQRTGDTSIISQHYKLLRKWADYLVENALAPGNQRTSESDGIVATNQTNLALKGVIGIGAMAKISAVVGEPDDASHYQEIALNYTEQWQKLSMSEDQSHIIAHYEDDGSYSLLYNLFAHKLLQLDLIPDAIFANQTSFYETLLPSFPFGLPLDSSDSDTSRSDWTMFIAAIASENTLRDGLITRLHAYASPNLENQPFEVVYNPRTGHQITGSASPAQGAMFAILANQAPIKLSPTISANSPSTSKGSGSSKAGIIVGVVVGVAVLFSATGLLFLNRRRRSKAKVATKHPALSGLIVEPFDITAAAIDDHAQDKISARDQYRATYNHDPLSTDSPTFSVPPATFAIPQASGLYEKQVRHGQRLDEERGALSSTSFGQVDENQRALVPSTGTSSSDPDLRRDLEELRREVVRIRQERNAADEAPPSYNSDDGDPFQR